jgi:hypothetical protein
MTRDFARVFVQSVSLFVVWSVELWTLPDGPVFLMCCLPAPPTRYGLEVGLLKNINLLFGLSQFNWIPVKNTFDPENPKRV